MFDIKEEFEGILSVGGINRVVGEVEGRGLFACGMGSKVGLGNNTRAVEDDFVVLEHNIEKRHLGSILVLHEECGVEEPRIQFYGGTFAGGGLIFGFCPIGWSFLFWCRQPLN